MFKLNKEILGQRTMKAHEASGAWNGGRSVTDAKAAGLSAGTRVATTFGWRPVEAVAVGDKVLTFDDGMQEVIRVERGYLWTNAAPTPRNLWPLEIPTGALGNQRPMLLMPEQSVMIESDAAEAAFGDPFTLIPAAALEGYKGIERVPPMEAIEVVTLHFAKDQVVFANVGALFFCPAAAEGDITPLWAVDAQESFYHTLSMDEAAVLLDFMDIEAQQASAQVYAA